MNTADGALNPATTGLDRRAVIAWRNAVFAIFSVMGIATGTWVSRVPAIRDSLDLRLDQVGILVAAVSVGSIVGLLFASHVIAWLGARKTILIVAVTAMVGIAIAGFGISGLENLVVTFVGFAIFGSLFAITDVAANVTGAANERALGQSVMPIFHAFFSIGTVAGSAVGVAAEWLDLGVAWHFGVVAVICIGIVVVASRSLVSESVTFEDAAAEGEPKPHWSERLRVWRDPRTILIGLMVLCAGLTEGVANDWIALASVDGHGFDNELASVVLVVFVSAMTVGRLAGVKLLDRFGRVPVLRGSFVLAALGLGVFIIAPVPAAVFAGAILWGLGAALGFPVGMSAAADDPAVAAARVSAVATIGYLAFLGGPPVIGFLGEHFGILSALLVALVLCVLGFLLSGSAREPKAEPELIESTTP